MLFIVRLPEEFIFSEFAPVIFPTVIFPGTGAPLVVASFTSPLAAIVPKVTSDSGLVTVILLPVIATVPSEFNWSALSDSPTSPFVALSVIFPPASSDFPEVVCVMLPFVAVAVIAPVSLLTRLFRVMLSPLRFTFPPASIVCVLNAPVALRSAVVPAIISVPASCVIAPPAVIETLVPASIVPSVCVIEPCEETVVAPLEDISELRSMFPPSAELVTVMSPAPAITS